MNVLLLIDALEIGGAETHVVTLAKGLTRAGHRVSVLSEGGTLEGSLRAQGVRLLHFPARICGVAFAFSLPALVGYLRQLQKQYRFDVMHAHTRRCALLLGLFRATRGWIPSRFLSVPAPFALDPPPYRKKSLLRLSFPALVVTAHARFAARYRCLSYWGDATIAVSEDLKRHTSRVFGVSSSRIRVIPNGIDLDVFFPSERAPRKAAKLTPFHVVFASRLDKDCSAAAHLLLALFPRWQEMARQKGQALQLSLLGGGSCREELPRLAKSINATSAATDEPPPVSVPGATDEPARVFRQADIFVGVSRAALEAIGCGCTVILAGNEGFGGVLTEQNFDRLAKENFCCRGSQALSEQELTQAFCYLLSLSPPERKALAQALRRRVEGGYGAGRMVRDTKDVYLQTLAKQRRLKLLIGGYAGCGNLGDDAILRQLIVRWHGSIASGTPMERIDRCYSAAANTVDVRWYLFALTGGGEGDMPTFGVNCVGRRNLFALWRASKQADAFVLGGGALLQNCSPHGTRSLLYYLTLLWLMRWRGCPFYLVANGIGPLRGCLARTMVGRILRHARGISVRDEASRRLLGDVGVDVTHVGLEPDPVLFLRPIPQEQAQKYLMQLLSPAISSSDILCVVPRDSDEISLDGLGEALREVCQRQGLSPLLFAFDAGKDKPVCRRLIDRIGFGSLCPYLHEDAVAGLFSISRGVISMRLHGLILAKTVDAPALCIPYSSADPKLTEFAGRAGQEMLVDLSSHRELSCRIDAFLERAKSKKGY